MSFGTKAPYFGILGTLLLSTFFPVFHKNNTINCAQKLSKKHNIYKSFLKGLIADEAKS